MVDVEYAADDTSWGPKEASEQFIEALEAQGWREDDRSEWGVRLTKGRWRVSVSPSTAYEEYGYGDPETDVDVEWAAS
jgi:hypothetical protein